MSEVRGFCDKMRKEPEEWRRKYKDAGKSDGAHQHIYPICAPMNTNLRRRTIISYDLAELVDKASMVDEITDVDLPRLYGLDPAPVLDGIPPWSWTASYESPHQYLVTDLLSFSCYSSPAILNALQSLHGPMFVLHGTSSSYDVRQRREQLEPIFERGQWKKRNSWGSLLCALNGRHYGENVGWAEGLGPELVQARKAIAAYQSLAQAEMPTSALGKKGDKKKMEWSAAGHPMSPRGACNSDDMGDMDVEVEEAVGKLSLELLHLARECLQHGAGRLGALAGTCVTLSKDPCKDSVTAVPATIGNGIVRGNWWWRCSWPDDRRTRSRSGSWLWSRKWLRWVDKGYSESGVVISDSNGEEKRGRTSAERGDGGWFWLRRGSSVRLVHSNSPGDKQVCEEGQREGRKGSVPHISPRLTKRIDERDRQAKPVDINTFGTEDQVHPRWNNLPHVTPQASQELECSEISLITSSRTKLVGSPISWGYWPYSFGKYWSMYRYRTGNTYSQPKIAIKECDKELGNEPAMEIPRKRADSRALVTFPKVCRSFSTTNGSVVKAFGNSDEDPHTPTRLRQLSADEIGWPGCQSNKTTMQSSHFVSDKT
ncbi:hypothetical protein BKA70DRAFT_1214192 [Coprinopsis sp. MPI-PUGE-AT-0042]|nr:hypothetical protein BKA70DRAFT_1214192 [Coprinopsis sp. MPI-PUGE-AT-0042]